MDKEEIDKYMDILGGDDRPDAEKFETAMSLIDMLITDLEDAEAALATYQLKPDSKYYYYVSYVHSEGYGCTQMETDNPIRGGMDVLDMIKTIQEGSEAMSQVIIINWIELDHM